MHELIIKYFSGTITPAEKDILFSEMMVNEDLKMEFASVQNIHALTTIIPAETDEADGLANLTVFKQSKRKKQIFSLMKQAIGYAAVICIAVLSTWYVMHSEEAEEEAFVIAYEEITAPAGQRALIKLHDGTSVWLNARSTLRYPNHFDKERRVELVGEAFFEVKEDKEHPFIVSTEKLDIEVLGTHFNVFAYNTQNEFSTSLLEGSVQIYDPRNKTNALLLQPNERAELVDNKLVKKSFRSKDFLLWRDGIYAFDDVSFSDIIKKLELYYDIRINLDNTTVSNYKFSGKFRQRDGIESVLHTLQKVRPFKYIKDDELNTITIR